MIDLPLSLCIFQRLKINLRFRTSHFKVTCSETEVSEQALIITLHNSLLFESKKYGTKPRIKIPHFSTIQKT